ncbi:MAG: hypothetical protein D6753_10990 [Planctomycetota bacterium]|nr:MAG: hypothetical protein D6753_10990 [Planctomycetota bacterium]
MSRIKHRRNFLQGAGGAMAASAAVGGTGGRAAEAFLGAAGRTETEAQSVPIAVFAKHLQALPPEELARRLGTLPVAGIEATLRRGGQIEPERLDAELGRLCDLLARYERRIVIAASDVNRATPAAQRYLRTLARHDIRLFRMAYYRYDFNRPIVPQMEAFARQAQELAELAKAEGVAGLYQNHAGRNYVGAALWDLAEVLREVGADDIGVAVDIRHTGVELTQSFQSATRRIDPHRRAVYVKDFRWSANGQPENVPLGQGLARPVFDDLQSLGFRGPLSLHMEYTDHRDPSQVEASWRAICNDVRTLQQWLQSPEASQG